MKKAAVTVWLGSAGMRRYAAPEHVADKRADEVLGEYPGDAVIAASVDLVLDRFDLEPKETHT